MPATAEPVRPPAIKGKVSRSLISKLVLKTIECACSGNPAEAQAQEDRCLIVPGSTFPRGGPTSHRIRCFFVRAVEIIIYPPVHSSNVAHLLAVFHLHLAQGATCNFHDVSHQLPAGWTGKETGLHPTRSPKIPLSERGQEIGSLRITSTLLGASKRHEPQARARLARPRSVSFRRKEWIPGVERAG